MWTAILSYTLVGTLSYFFRKKLRTYISEKPLKFGSIILSSYALLDLAIKYKTRAVSTLAPSSVGNANIKIPPAIVSKQPFVPIEPEEKVFEGPVRGPVPEGYGYSTHKPPTSNTFDKNRSCVAIEYYDE